MYTNDNIILVLKILAKVTFRGGYTISKFRGVCGFSVVTFLNNSENN